ncbi:MAG: ATP-binding protein [Thermodesulfobacteriota bacterium]
MHSSACLLRGYCSILGLKIALLSGFFLILPIVAYVFLHEFQREGFNEAYAVGTSPLLWGGMLGSFTLLMFFLSRLVILPLKKFEMHIGKIEKGDDAGPFILNRKDELGVLAERFNSLHKLVADEMGSKETQLSVHYRFTNAASGIFDVPTLMESFFTILKTAVPFDVGAYVLDYQDYSDGRIYSATGALSADDAEEITHKAVGMALSHCKDFPVDKIGSRLGVSVIGTEGGGPGRGAAASNEVALPITFYGEPVGMVMLLADADISAGSRLFESMVGQTSMIIQRLLAHINAEQRQLADILSSMAEGVYLVDGKGRATSINKKGMELVGSFCKYSFECSRTGSNCVGNCTVSPSDACQFSKLIDKVKGFGPEREGTVYTDEMKSANGRVLQVSVNSLKSGASRKGGFVVTAKDVTEDRLIQKRVMLSSKLAALGEMAAGIAHEVNNPLQVLLANLELLNDGIDEKGKKRLYKLKDGVFRIKNIVKDLLIFAREQTTEVEDTDVNKVVGKIVDILGHQLSVANIKIELDLDRRAMTVRCNRNLFQQVMINLLHNAKDAIEESAKGSRVRIRTELLAGGTVMMEVSDDGPGIPEEVIDRIFDPFFTTKDVGKGTGLGLSVSRRIIEGMGGNIAVASSKEGTTFTITLLHSGKRRKEDRAPEKAVADHSCLAGKSVIVVDDEETTRSAIMEIIGPSVADVEGLPDGASALARIMDRDYDVVLLDIKMPGMNGMELYGKIREIKPYLAERVFFITGDTENESTQSFIKLTGCGYLAKPFTREDLLSLVSEHEMEVCG